MARTPIRCSCASLLLAAALPAQQAGPARGSDVNGYNVVNWFETGYRFAEVGGDFGKYRSDVNYGNGVRLLGSSFTAHSLDGHGRYFDELAIQTLGLGNDPYQSATFRAQKNRVYRYDLRWWLNEYYSPALRIAQGQHLEDTRRRFQDHDLTLFPQSGLKFRFGYSRNSQTGPGLSTVQQFGAREDEFPLFADVRRQRNEYRLGGEAGGEGLKLTWLHRWDFYKDDSTQFLTGASAGNNSLDRIALSRFYRAQPYHGSTPAWLVNLRAERSRWAANGRFAYAGGRRDFLFDESAFGSDRFGLARARQILVAGNARRPVTSGDFLLSFFPGGRVTVTNNTAFHSTRIDGDAAYRELDLASLLSEVVYFRFLGIRTASNATQLYFQAVPQAGFHAGYQFATRRVRSIENFSVPGFGGDGVRAEQENRVHSGLFGIRLTPVRALRLLVDAEVSRADRPFFPVSDRNYHALAGRLEYRSRAFSAAAAYRQNYNFNSIAVTAHSSRARSYSGDLSWTSRDWLGFDAGYSKLHLDTVSGLAFFAGAPRAELITDRRSLYFSNIHSGNAGVRLGLGNRVDLNLAYVLTKDTGDGRADPLASPAGRDPIALALAPAQTYPLSFQSPLARISLRLHTRLRWNAAWQFYRYRENFFYFQNYRAHTGYTSLLWSF